MDGEGPADPPPGVAGGAWRCDQARGRGCANESAAGSGRGNEAGGRGAAARSGDSAPARVCGRGEVTRNVVASLILREPQDEREASPYANAEVLEPGAVQQRWKREV